MARQNGIITIKGTLAGLTFYERDGQLLIKTSSAASGKRIKTDPRYKRVRENMAEFGGAAKIGKALRLGVSAVVKGMSEMTTIGRLTAVMKRSITMGTGAKGERYFDAVASSAYIVGFEFNKHVALERIFFAPYPPPLLGVNRSVATWVVPDFSTDDFINAPEGATHFRLILTNSVLSNYLYSPTLHAYVAEYPAADSVGAVASSEEIALGGMVGSTTSLIADTGFGSSLPTGVGVVLCIGIVFLQEVNGVFYELESDNGMRIEVIK